MNNFKEEIAIINESFKQSKKLIGIDEGIKDTPYNHSFKNELKKQGFTGKICTDDKTGKKFIGWSINK